MSDRCCTNGCCAKKRHYCCVSPCCRCCHERWHNRYGRVNPARSVRPSDYYQYLVPRCYCGHRQHLRGYVRCGWLPVRRDARLSNYPWDVSHRNDVRCHRQDNNSCCGPNASPNRCSPNSGHSTRGYSSNPNRTNTISHNGKACVSRGSTRGYKPRDHTSPHTRDCTSPCTRDNKTKPSHMRHNPNHFPQPG